MGHIFLTVWALPRSPLQPCLRLTPTSLAYKHLELVLTYTSWGDFETGVRRVHEAFTDGAALPGFCRDAFAWAVQNGLVSGMDGALNASGTANRAQLATVLMHYAALSK